MPRRRIASSGNKVSPFADFSSPAPSASPPSPRRDSHYVFFFFNVANCQFYIEFRIRTSFFFFCFFIFLSSGFHSEFFIVEFVINLYSNFRFSSDKSDSYFDPRLRYHSSPRNEKTRYSKCRVSSFDDFVNNLPATKAELLAYSYKTRKYIVGVREYILIRKYLIHRCEK